MKRFISGLIIGAVLGSSLFVFAETSQWIAQKATFKVMVRGEEFESENPPVVVEGRTYLPLRAMGEALGVDVEWNAQLKQAEVAMVPRRFNLDIGSAEAKPGDTIEIPINFSSVPAVKIATGNLMFSYDSSVLELINVTPGEIVKNPQVNFESNNDSSNTVSILFLDYTMKGGESISENGVFAKFQFKVKDDAKAGKSYIILSKKAEFAATDLKRLDIKLEDGLINISE